MSSNERLVVVSNRVPSQWGLASDAPDRAGPAGGLVSALKASMATGGGLWIGWSGRSAQRRTGQQPTVSELGPVQLATIDLSEDEVSLYYTGFANRTLWPLFHSFPERVVIRRDSYYAYRRVSRRFAEAVYSMLRPGDTVWVHDYHLFFLAQDLRWMGWRGKIGFFLHIPFPPAELFAILAWGKEILEGLTHYDLVGVHTDRYLQNLADALCTQLGGVFQGDTYASDSGSVRLGIYPVGIEPTDFEVREGLEVRGLAEQLSIPLSPHHSIILGVDRLDYTKGIPERLRAFRRLFEHRPSVRGNATFVQISSPSRTRVPEYAQEKQRVETQVGEINGLFSEGGWVPVRYLYRSFPQWELARFYREADVCMVTPLRDGMNLVAKEFVAAQGDDPGVLVLSRFTGAADTMKGAMLVNPHDVDGTAEALFQAIRLPLRERRQRWQSLISEVRTNTAQHWSQSFLGDLARSNSQP